MIFEIFNNTFSLALGILLPLLTFIALLIYWYRHGKDLSVGIIPVTYKVDEDFSKLTDVEKSIIQKQKTPINIISSILIELEHLGYLSFEKVGNKSSLEDFKIRIVKDTKDNLPEYLKIYLRLLKMHQETEFLKSELTSTWKYYDYSDIYKVQESLYKELERKNYFCDNILRTKDKYFQLGWGLVLLGCFLTSFTCVIFHYVSFFKWLFYPSLGIIASGFVVMIFTPLMPKRTKRGLKALKEFLGFKEFFKRVEKPKLLRNSNKSISTTTRNELKQRIKVISPWSFMIIGVLLSVISERYNLSSEIQWIGFLLILIGMLTSARKKSILNIK